MGKWDYGGEDFEESNYQFINIINISKNESYGVVYMFLTRPSPLSLRVKSKKIELLLLRKNDALDISQRYPNIWMKYLKKSYFNILSIKKIAVNKIKHYWENLEKKSKLKKPILKSKTNIHPFTIYKLKHNETNEFLNFGKNKSNDIIINLGNIRKSKSLGKKKIQSFKENNNFKKISNFSQNNNKELLSSTNHFNRSLDSSFKKTTKKSLHLNNKKEKNKDNNINDKVKKSRLSSNIIEEIKSPLSPLNKSNF